MMKRLFSMAAAFAAILAFASCQDAIQPVSPDNPAAGSGIKVFTATTEAAATKTALADNDTDGYDVNWEAGDEITIVDNAGHVGIYKSVGSGTKTDFTFKSGTEVSEAPFKAYYPASLYNSGSPALPAVQEYTSGNIHESPMYAESSSASLQFKNLVGIIRLNVSTSQSDKKVRRIGLSATTGMSGTIANTATLVDNGYSATVSGNAGITFNCEGSGVDITSAPTAFYFAVPAGSYTSLKINVLTTEGKVQSRTSNKTITVTRSQITDVTLSFNSFAEPSFSVSADKKVTFAPGNLQATYDATAQTWTWGFAAHQYDYIGNAPGNTTITTEIKEDTEPYAKLSESGTVDLFGWSTSDTYYGIASSTDHANYTTEAFEDWGGLVIDSYAANYWRTLSADEWDYLLNTRSCSTIGGTENARYFKANTVSDVVQGLIVFPDDFTWDETTMGTVPSGCNQPRAYITQQFTPSQWASLEAAGAVFLPLSGYKYRYGLSVGYQGNYWSSTKNNSNRANYLWFSYKDKNNSSLSAQDHDYGDYYANSVRLVHDL